MKWSRNECSAGANGGSRIELRRKEGSMGEMVELKSETVKLPVCDFILSWQLKQYSKLCASVPEGGAIADFAEIYLCEKQDQPQSSYCGYTQMTVQPCECSKGKRTLL